MHILYRIGVPFTAKGARARSVHCGETIPDPWIWHDGLVYGSGEGVPFQETSRSRKGSHNVASQPASPASACVYSALGMPLVFR